MADAGVRAETRCVAVVYGPDGVPKIDDDFVIGLDKVHREAVCANLRRHGHSKPDSILGWKITRRIKRFIKKLWQH